MDMDRIFQELTLGERINPAKKQEREMTEEEIFDDSDDDLDIINNNRFEVSDEDIFGGDLKYIEQTIRISELEKENSMLRQENNILKQKHPEYNQEMSLSVPKKEKPSAYRQDIDLEELETLYKKGISMNRIGTMLGCSPHTVKRRLKELGILK